MTGNNMNNNKNNNKQDVTGDVGRGIWNVFYSSPFASLLTTELSHLTAVRHALRLCCYVNSLACTLLRFFVHDYLQLILIKLNKTIYFYLSTPIVDYIISSFSFKCFSTNMSVALKRVQQSDKTQA